MAEFNLQSEFNPEGDQPQAIKALVSGLNNNAKHQTLLGITGSGKTFTMANVIQHVPVSYTHLTLATNREV